MSNYRDDTTETAIAGNDTWLGLTSIVEENVWIAGVALFGLTVLHTDQAQAADEVIDQANHTVVEQAQVTDETFGQKHSLSTVTEQARVVEGYRYRIESMTVEQAQAADSVMDNLAALTTEQAQVKGDFFDQKHSESLVTEQARMDEEWRRVATEQIAEQTAISGEFTGQLSASAMIADSAEIADSVMDSHTATTRATVETAVAGDEVIDQLAAFNLVTDTAVIEGVAVTDNPDFGTAWTANIETWGMSRYQPYGFEEIAVIDGVAYGVRKDGLYKLRGGSEEITGTLKTGRLDLGDGQLVHPTEAYTEYELTGKMEMDVVTTQRGTEQAYTYRLPAELADDLTNGRIRFGKGLKGRHFRFNLRMTGQHGYINDLSVRTAPSKRRV